MNDPELERVRRQLAAMRWLILPLAGMVLYVAFFQTHAWSQRSELIQSAVILLGSFWFTGWQLKKRSK